MLIIFHNVEHVTVYESKCFYSKYSKYSREKNLFVENLSNRRTILFL